jgi:hypothetical protein
MNLSSTANNSNDPQVWSNLKQAIATSSGFDKWQHSRDVDPTLDSKVDNLTEESLSLPIVQEVGLDDLVRSYLRETLETLAY